MLSTLTWLYGQPLADGTIKVQDEDFIVNEDLGFEPDNEGEHVLVRVKKQGCNTGFVAEALAKFAGIAARSVSYAGLKDRHAITEQWFCLHLPGKNTPDFTQFVLEGCEIISVARHLRKLRIGALRGNYFQLVIKNITDHSNVDYRLQQIKKGGVPNYFGEQRFGYGGNNLIQAQRWANNEINVKERSKRSFYLSAIRSMLFNRIVSQRISENSVKQVLEGDALQLTGRGSWFVALDHELAALQQRVDAGELQITALLAGKGDFGSQQNALKFEQRQLVEYDSLLELLIKQRVDASRRATLVPVSELQWQWFDKQTLQLRFWLPAGSFATSVVRELINTAN